mmetsp:Transcript_24686/g.57341  ORF Transcript_24686/g.57341 Transcript_24686/m.57341 type:complete len:247 (+) Transcript_24686:1401-2141(+)
MAPKSERCVVAQTKVVFVLSTTETPSWDQSAMDASQKAHSVNWVTSSNVNVRMMGSSKLLKVKALPSAAKMLIFKDACTTVPTFSSSEPPPPPSLSVPFPALSSPPSELPVKALTTSVRGVMTTTIPPPPSLLGSPPVGKFANVSGGTATDTSSPASNTIDSVVLSMLLVSIFSAMTVTPPTVTLLRLEFPANSCSTRATSSFSTSAISAVTTLSGGGCPNSPVEKLAFRAAASSATSRSSCSSKL